jgi:small subunit ribosomal protein S8
MSMTDPVADMLARIRNAGLTRLSTVDVPASKIKVRIAEILRDEGFIEGFRLNEDAHEGRLSIDLKYDADRRLVIKEMRRMSRPGRRMYAPCDGIPKSRDGLGICIVSTSQGLMTDRDARKRRVGGELICEVW